MGHLFWAKINANTVSAHTLPALKNYFPEDIEIGTRIQRKGEGGSEIQIGDKRFPGSISLVDEEFIEIFQVEVLKGSMKSTFNAPGNLAISEASAFQYFGDKDPIGEVITFKYATGGEVQYKVTAIYRFVSPNTVLNIPNFSLLGEAGIQYNWNWGGESFTYQTIIRFNETADIKKFTDRLPSFVNQIIPASSMLEPLKPDQKLSDIRIYSIQKMRDMYFETGIVQVSPPFEGKKGNRIVITVFIIISIVVLMMGCINFVILTTAKATQRAREVAMRKVVGARFGQLIFQFLGESVLIAFLAFLFALALTELALPFFEGFVDKKLMVPYSSPESYIFVILLLILVGFLGGFYPALVLSKFSPSRALKANQTTEAGGSFTLRNILVVFQFAASITLIITTVVAYCQLKYATHHDPGFNPDKMLVVEGVGAPYARDHVKTLQQELSKLTSVNNVALSNIQPKLGGIHFLGGPLRVKTDGTTPSQKIDLGYMLVGYNFFKTYEIPLITGRIFIPGRDKEMPDFRNPAPSEDDTVSKEDPIIINYTAARQLGFASAEEAIGKILESGDPGTPFYSEFSIIGVVKDSQYRSLRNKPFREVYQLAPDHPWFLNIKYQGDYQAVVEDVRRVWESVIGDFPFRDSNVKQNLATTFIQEEKENKALIAFALLAIFISCMGLFGMASFTVDRRVKEIGLRKVMGAKIKDIVRLLSWQFLKPVLIANIIAWPVAIFAMQSWLERFQYQINPLLMIPICLVSGMIALVIAWFTVSGNTSRVAKSRPIKALRYE